MTPDSALDIRARELAPCPAAAIHTIDRGAPYTGYRRSDAWFARCETCGCTTEYYGTEAEAITAWNTRTALLDHPVIDREAIRREAFEEAAARAEEYPSRLDDMGAVEAVRGIAHAIRSLSPTTAPIDQAQGVRDG